MPLPFVSLIRTPKALALVALGAAVVAGGLYGTGLIGTSRACAASEALADRLRPLATGEVAGFRVEAAPAPVPALAFEAPGGGTKTLADFRGRTVLLNLWATWCEPCKREMPALDRTQATLGSDRFEVVAVNLDTRDLDRPRRWLVENGIASLAYYGDRQAKVFQDLRRAGWTEGLPTTILVGPDGCRIGQLSGWAEWASAEGLRLLRMSF